MKITLIQPPLLEQAANMLSPPLGLLSLAATAREQGVEASVLDFNLKGFQVPEFREPERFYVEAVELIEETKPDIVGFTSMGLESHVCLELAKKLKEQNPKLITLLGGAHFTSIAIDVIEKYEWVDFVICGEAEIPILHLLDALDQGTWNDEIHNVAFRNGRGEAKLRRNILAKVDLDTIPFPAYDLINPEDYFAVNPYRMTCLEHARGCQLKCSFCYSQSHWGHGERGKSTARIIEELKLIRDLGWENVFFVADNFVTNREATEALCKEIENAKLNLDWNCYATLAQLDKNTLAYMSRAGCTSVFVGVDAVSGINKKNFKKSYFKGWEQLEKKLRLCMSAGILPTCSFMVSDTDSVEGIEETIRTALFSRNIGASVVVNALAIYGETGCKKERIGAKASYSNLKVALLFDTPKLNEDNTFAMKSPDLFPMHQGGTIRVLNSDLSVFCSVVNNLLFAFPRTLIRLVFDNDLKLVSFVEKVLNDIATSDADKKINYGIDLARIAELLEKVTSEKCSLANQTLALEKWMLPKIALVPSQHLLIKSGDKESAISTDQFVVVRSPVVPSQLGEMNFITSAKQANYYLISRSHGAESYRAIDQGLGQLLQGACSKQPSTKPIEIEESAFMLLSA